MSKVFLVVMEAEGESTIKVFRTRTDAARGMSDWVSEVEDELVEAEYEDVKVRFVDDSAFVQTFASLHYFRIEEQEVLV